MLLPLDHHDDHYHPCTEKIVYVLPEWLPEVIHHKVLWVASHDILEEHSSHHTGPISVCLPSKPLNRGCHVCFHRPFSVAHERKRPVMWGCCPACNRKVPQWLIGKLSLLGLTPSLGIWIEDYLTGRTLESVRISNTTSSTTTLNTTITLLTLDCAVKYSSKHIMKFADDTTVVGFIGNIWGVSIQKGWWSSLQNDVWENNHLSVSIRPLRWLLTSGGPE